jgi:hypothetical protein
VPATSKECRPIFRSSTCQRRFFLPHHFCCRNIFIPHDKDSFSRPQVRSAGQFFARAPVSEDFSYLIVFAVETFSFPTIRIRFAFRFSPRWFLPPRILLFLLGFGRPHPCFDSRYLALIPLLEMSSPVSCFRARPRISSSVDRFLQSLIFIL